MRGRDRTYIRNMAKSMIGQLGVKPEDRIYSNDFQVLGGKYGCRLLNIVCKMSPETLGRVVAYLPDDEKRQLYGCDFVFNEGWDGRSMLVMLARTSIIVEMCDILRLSR